ncbi:putative diguanylate cyclase YcdT [compost metagenome]
MVLTETNHAGAMHFCERLRESIAKTTFRSGEDSIQLTASLGFAITVPGENISARELVRRADHALYDAKRGGRNSVAFARPETNKVVELKPAARQRKKVAGE